MVGTVRRVAEFLSDEWIAALALACGGEPGTAERAADLLVVEPVVVGIPERGEVRYRLSFHDASCTVTDASVGAPAADVCLETDYATAVALARGEMNAQAALAAGRLRVSGDVARLAAHAAALARLGDVFAAVRTSTTFPGRSEPPARPRD
jgi:putative sterol carrier protein